MKAQITFDENGYIIRFLTDINGDYDVEDNFDFDYLHCYHLVKGRLVLDEERKAKDIEAYAIAEEIADLKQKLKDTDYIFSQEIEEITALSNPVTFISDFIKILVSYSNKYKDAISNRKAWRDRIRELEG